MRNRHDEDLLGWAPWSLGYCSSLSPGQSWALWFLIILHGVPQGLIPVIPSIPTPFPTSNGKGIRRPASTAVATPSSLRWRRPGEELIDSWESRQQLGLRSQAFEGQDPSLLPTPLTSSPDTRCAEVKGVSYDVAGKTQRPHFLTQVRDAEKSDWFLPPSRVPTLIQGTFEDRYPSLLLLPSPTKI